LIEDFTIPPTEVFKGVDLENRRVVEVRERNSSGRL
jgi:hypothetical protein